MTTVTIDALPAWVKATCPSWCEYEHGRWPLTGDDCEIHTRRFGGGAAGHGWVSLCVVIGQDGTPMTWDGNVEGFEIDDPNGAEALDAMADVLREAAEWIRTTVRPMFGVPTSA